MPDYSAQVRNERERRYAISVVVRLLRTDAENRRFRQRSRIAYNAPVFTGLIDCTGPVLLLVAVSGRMRPAGTFSHWSKVICSHLLARARRITQLIFQPCATQGNFPLSTKRKIPLSQTGVFRYYSPIQNWIRLSSLLKASTATHKINHAPAFLSPARAATFADT